VDPLYHPDLVVLDHRLTARFAAVSAAEHEAAVIAHRRTTTLRDRLLEAEDRLESATVYLSDGSRRQGKVMSVGLDHVAIGSSLLALAHIVGFEVER